MSEVINEAVVALNDKMNGGFDGTAKFVVEGEGAIIIDENGARAGDDDADVTLTADADTFREILSGELNPTSAFMTGKLSVDGDMGKAMALGTVLLSRARTLQVTGMEDAPFYDDIAEGPSGGQAVWTRTKDGLRIRVGWWPAKGAAKGTVLIFPGRTEYIEKYGRDAVELTRAGYAVLAIDWRGQGIADRMVANARVGHVGEFTDYQRDVAAVLDVARSAQLPKPWHVLGHSMGGCIALRSVMEGLEVNSAIFSAPMWGIRMAAPTRPAAWALSWSGSVLGLGHLMAPGTKEEPYPLDAAFEDNKLTSDRDMYDYMRRQLIEHPDLSLGGPSLHWLNQALAETLALARRPAPALPCLTFLGDAEAIVDPARVLTRMHNWPEGELVMLPDARHEVLMETPETRAKIFDRLIPFLNDHATAPPAPARSA